MRPTKRDELVQKALQTFYRNGFHATGMDMLVAETGIKEGAMVTAHLGHTDNPARDAKAAAVQLLNIHSQ